MPPTCPRTSERRSGSLNAIFGGLTALADRAGGPAALWQRLSKLPGYSPAAAHLFLRELWSHWPEARPSFGAPIAYDAWFSAHPAAYQAELDTVARLLPSGSGVEICVGTGRFAVPLGIRLGVEPAAEMAALARARGLEVLSGTAEALPLPSGSFDFALLITVLCFTIDPGAALAEAHRILRPGGSLLIGLIDPETPLGRRYLAHQAESPFYRAAHFRPVPETLSLAQRQGFQRFRFAQALFGLHPDWLDPSLPTVRAGFGRGGFAVIRADR